MRVLVALSIGLVLSGAVEAEPMSRVRQGAIAQTERTTPAESLEKALGELRELAELDLVAELIPKGREWVGSGGVLAGSGEARALVAHALHNAGEEEEALAILMSGELANSERAWVDLERVRLHLEQDQLDSALKLLTLAPDSPDQADSLALRHPQIEESWLLLARTFARAGDLRRSAKAAQEFVKRAPLHPGAPNALHLLATAAVEVRNPELANSYLSRARELERWHQILLARRLQLRRNPDAPLPRLGLGMAWMQVRAHDRALVEFERLVSEHPTYSRGWFHLGEAHRLKGDLDAAYLAYGRAVETDAAQHLARFNRAIIDLMNQRPAEARRALEILVANPEVESDPRFVEAHMHLGKLCEAAGERDQARAHMARYEELRAALEE